MITGNVKDSYTTAQWENREIYYTTELDNLVIPHDCNTAQIRELAARLDAVRAEATMEFALCSRKFESLDRVKKLTEKELFLLIKSQAIPGLKTEGEVGGGVAIAIKDIPATDLLQGKGITLNLQNLINAMTPINQQQIPPTPAAVATPAAPAPVTIIPALQIAENRMLFMQGVLNVIREKSSALITIEGALKLEADIGRQSGGTTTPSANAGNMLP